MEPKRQMNSGVEFREFKSRLTQDGLVVLSAEIPAELLTPAAVFLRLGGDRARSSFLFESVETGGRIGRYSFIGIDPIEEIRLSESGGHHRIGSWIAAFSPAEFPTVVRAPLQRRSRFHDDHTPQGLAGGWVGFFSYDWVRMLERLPEHTTDHLRHPWVSLGLYDEIIVFDHVYQTAHVNLAVRATGDTGLSVLRRAHDTGQRRLERTVRRLRQPQSLPSVGRLTPRPIQSNTTPRGFTEAVRTIKRHIGRGDIFQCVLSQRFSVDGPVRPFDVYRRLRRSNPSPYMYFLKTDKLAIAGSSPETLVQKSGSSIRTRPIAGTRPRGDDSGEDSRLERQLLASPKENAEHIMLVDLGRNDLGRVGQAGSVKTTSFRRIERYSHVMHMVSEVEGKAKPRVDALDVLAATFPAGTVTGAPKIRAMEIIESVEPERRGIYAGCVGYIDWWGNLDTAIAIRTAVMDRRGAHTQAGAGIVADSDPEREYRETQNKAAAPLSALGGVWKRGQKP